MYAIIGVVGHFINKDGRRRYVIFRLREIISKHTTKNIAGVLIVLFYNYMIINNIRYSIANNMELNNIYINIILHTLYLNILAKLYKGRRLYYFSYIINLYA